MTVTHELRAAQGPMRPRILRIRTDLSWKEVVLNAQGERQYIQGRQMEGRGERGERRGERGGGRGKRGEGRGERGEGRGERGEGRGERGERRISGATTNARTRIHQATDGILDPK